MRGAPRIGECLGDKNGRLRHLCNRCFFGGGMASFLRLIFGFCFLFGVAISHAITPTQEWVTSSSPCGAGTFTGPSLSSACSAYVNGGLICYTSATYTLGNVYPNAYGTAGTCSILRNGSTSGGLSVSASRLADTCPANSTLTAGSCQCNSGYSENSDGTSCLPIPPVCNSPQIVVNGQCVDPPSCPAPKQMIDGVCSDPPPPECKIPLGSISNASTGQFTGSGYGGGMACFQECISYPAFSGRNPEGQYFAHGPWTSTGVTCSGTGSGSSPPPPSDPNDPGSPPADPSAPPDPDPPPVQPPPDQCPVGTCPGSVNGTTVCVLCSNTTTNSTNNTNSTSNKTNPDGSPNNDPDSSGGSPNGTTTSTGTTSTKCVDGKCTTETTTTTTNPDGTTTTKTDKKEETKDDFCTQNPKSPLCVEGTFGGACSGGFQCTGDAVQCATAKAVNEQMCAMKVDSTNAIVSLGSSSMDGGNGTGHPIDSITELDVGVLNQANPWGAGCPADRVLTTFMGKAIVVPLSSACSTFQIMGNVLVGFALLAGAFIVVGRT